MAPHVVPSPGELIRRLRRDGVRGLAVRAVYEAYHRLGAESAAAPLAVADIVSSHELAARAEAPARPGPLRIAWLIAPPAPGSGGHTTLFRMVAELSRRGHENTLALYDPRRSESARHAATIAAAWPWLGVPGAVAVADAHDGLDGYDVVVASSWQTAHVAAGRAGAHARLMYFIQDFEPYFYPHGAYYALAEDSYRFGMTNIALGEMVRRCLDELGVPSIGVPFGADASRYAPSGDHERAGITAYVRTANDRRGYVLARAALARFHERHPEQLVHVYGDAVADWPFPVVSHGHLTPAELNELYNRVHGGLALSFTNVSLIAGEMLAAGAIPVLNDHPHVRADLPHPEAVWAAPTPAALADALCRLVEEPDPRARAARASGLALPSWAPTQRAVADLVEGLAPVAGEAAPARTAAS